MEKESLRRRLPVHAMPSPCVHGVRVMSGADTAWDIASCACKGGGRARRTLPTLLFLVLLRHSWHKLSVFASLAEGQDLSLIHISEPTRPRLI
eukprot:3406012-Rhodomonas_salina.1